VEAWGNQASQVLWARGQFGKILPTDNLLISINHLKMYNLSSWSLFSPHNKKPRKGFAGIDLHLSIIYIYE
jgi:hypothetical protein